MRYWKRSGMFLLGVALLFALLGAAPAHAPRSVVLTAMEQELDRTWKEVKRDPQAPLYFLGYAVTEARQEALSAAGGAITQDDSSHNRVLDVSARVGGPELDNTHEIRGEGGGGGFGGATPVPLDDDPDALRAAIWQATDQKIKAAQERFIRVKTDQAVKVGEAHPAPDFSREEPQVHIDALPSLAFNRAAWRDRVRTLSRRLQQYPFVLDGSVSLSTVVTHTFQANSEGTRLQFGRTHVRLGVSLEGMAKDGMSLQRQETFDARDFSGLPNDNKVLATIDRLAKELDELRQAPQAEPYTGPAILMNRASGVLFHEIFGHRVEGQRQKRSDEGQTFTARVGQPILPSFLTVVDDPSMAKLGNQELNGYYPFDDEGVPSQRVTLVQNGVLKNFLLSRSPLQDFPRSNGHGRRQPGREPVSRQGNLMVLSTKQVPYAELRRMLLAECRKQGKPYGLVFDDIEGGYTTTERSGPQAFKVLPLLVNRVYTDGRPDEIVRGVDIVGTPLESFSKIVATADDTAVFNGYCGAESGYVPVSAISPSILVSEMEVEKQEQGSDRPPILPPPAAGDGTFGDGATGRRGGGAPRPGAARPEDDPTLKAMADELARTRTQLKMDTTAPPYFVAYTAHDTESVSVLAGMGALMSSDHGSGRQLWTDVRVGDAAFDSSNFGGRGFSPAIELPLDDDYGATRRSTWLATDSAYKSAIQTLSNKRAALQNQAEEPRPPDLGKAEPYSVTTGPATLDVDRTAWEKTARAVSGVFRRFPAVEDGRIGLRAERQTQRFINSEGSWHRTGRVLAEVTLRASARAADGTWVSDSRRFYARRAADLPSQEKLSAAASELATSLTQLAAAGKAEEYTGPVLFTGEAAAVFFDRLLADKLADPAVPVSANPRGGPSPRGDKLTGQLGRRILPAGFQAVDDPTKDTLDGIPLFGGYAVDDDGVPAAPVTLVEDGQLKAFYMSRIPTKEIPASNGHGRRAFGSRVTGQPANLIVTAAASSGDLKQKLQAICKDEGLPYALIVESFDASPGRGGLRRGFGGRGRGFGGPPADASDLPDPVAFRKLYADGHEEAIRGGHLAGVTAHALRSIVAAGADRNVATRRLSGLGPACVTVVAPSVIVTQLDVRPTEGGGEKPPLIPRPSLAMN